MIGYVSSVVIQHNVYDTDHATMHTYCNLTCSINIVVVKQCNCFSLMLPITMVTVTADAVNDALTVPGLVDYITNLTLLTWCVCVCSCTASVGIMYVRGYPSVVCS